MLPAEVVWPVAGHIVKEKFVWVLFLQMWGGYTYTYLIDYPFRVLAFVLVVVDAISLVNLNVYMVILNFLPVVGGYTYSVDYLFRVLAWVRVVADASKKFAVVMCKLVLDMPVVWVRGCRPPELRERSCPRHSGAPGPAVVRGQPQIVQERSLPRHSGAPGPAVLQGRLVCVQVKSGSRHSGAPGPAVVGLLRMSMW